MGNSSNKILKTGSLPESCNAYSKIINYIVETPPDKELLLQNIIAYISKIKEDSPCYEFVATVHKLHPHIYREKPIELLDPVWLYQACVRQMVYCKKIQPFLKNYNYKRWRSEYKRFLRDCKLFKHVIIVPNLIEDFMWHSHMQSPTYKRDITLLTGRFMDHDDDIPEEKLQKFKNIRVFLRRQVEYDEKDDGTCATERPRPVYTRNSSGGSSCGSSCGGGGCGGCG